MSFIIYFFVLLVSAMSVLFGLDLVNSPLPNTPNVPIGRNVQVSSRPSPQGRHNEDVRALMPVRPAVPAVSKDAQTSGIASHQDVWLPPPATTQATAAQRVDNKTTAEPMTPARGERSTPTKLAAPAATSPTQNIAQTPARETAASKQAKVETSSQPTAAVEAKPAQAATTQPAQPVAQQAPSSCNIQACGAAYHSFHASDCTYRPYGGPRRSCTMKGNATTASVQRLASRPRQTAHQASDMDKLGEVERIVRHQPLQLEQFGRPARNTREMSELERIVLHMTPDNETDIPVQGPDGKIIIVRKSYR